MASGEECQESGQAQPTIDRRQTSRHRNRNDSYVRRDESVFRLCGARIWNVTRIAAEDATLLTEILRANATEATAFSLFFGGLFRGGAATTV